MAYVEEPDRIPYGECLFGDSLEPEGKAEAGEISYVSILFVIFMQVD
jgi:hypothetical protein